ncbi:secreted protein [Rhodopirellula maiorica SM1]|uniref:Secreted protein n=1 Tax=Rhodopirellula maiorica SM1 TaxID=1265738 RepID=M5RS29_9BACT|nr:secreted protein [Rhodopirellula maiorica]EMI22100.1 secreted protein [Rhodopirellula maiorica SM1]
MNQMGYLRASSRAIAFALFSLTLLSSIATVQWTFAQELNGQNSDSTAKFSPVYLDVPQLSESSGLAASHRRLEHFWSHNDSGDTARLFAFDVRGRATGSCELVAASSVDWEDMASFELGDRKYLLVADCGDNDSKRDACFIYLFDEPDPTRATKIKSYLTLQLTYPDGARDCEAVAVDPTRGKILMIAKSAIPYVNVYSVELSGLLERLETVRTNSSSSILPVVRAVAKIEGVLALPMVSAADIDSRTGDLWIANYFQAFCFRCSPRNMSVAEQTKQAAEASDLPRLRQIEALCMNDGGDVWVTSEGTPAALSRVTKP